MRAGGRRVCQAMRTKGNLMLDTRVFLLRAAAGLIILLFSLILAACFPFGATRADMSANITLTVEDDHFAVVQCVNPDYKVNHVAIMAGPAVKGAKKEWLFLAEVAASDSVELPYRSPIGISQLSKKMPAKSANDVKVSSFGERVSLLLALDGPNGRVEMSYLNVDVSALTPGSYVHGSGIVDRDACDRSSSAG